MTTNDSMRSTALPERISGLGPLSVELVNDRVRNDNDLRRECAQRSGSDLAKLAERI